MTLRNYILLIALLMGFNSRAEIISEAQPNEEIRRVVEGGFWSFNESLITKIQTSEFYYQREFEAAWTSNTNVSELISSIKEVKAEGLDPVDYHYEILKNIDPSKSRSGELDVLLTDSYLLLASHLLTGKTDPETIYPQWKVNRREMDLKMLLKQSLETGMIASGLHSLVPNHPYYNALKNALVYYREIEDLGGWRSIADGESLKPGMLDTRVPPLRDRLAVTGEYLPGETDTSMVYDSVLAASVAAFQEKHGLLADGVVGKGTLSALNEPVSFRIRQIILNMERCRWLPLSLGDHYLIVNIADFTIQAYRNGTKELEMNVVVGKPFRKTPVFSSRLLYTVINPYWTVPPTILKQDILPEIKKDPGYLERLNIKIVQGTQEIDPATINWDSLKGFPYQLRQDPGAKNALGVVKFIFPNPYNVYIHDTNHPELFKRADRALSSGCIRLSKPRDMAAYLLKDHPDGWTREKIDEVIGTNKSYTVMMTHEIWVHLLYWTAFVDDKGNVNFRKDVYQRDDVLWNALQARAAINY